MNANCCSWERWRPAGGLLISRFCNSPASRRRSQGFTLISRGSGMLTWAICVSGVGVP